MGQLSWGSRVTETPLLTQPRGRRSERCPMCLQGSLGTHAQTHASAPRLTACPLPSSVFSAPPRARLLFWEVPKPLLKYFLHPSSGLPYLPSDI